MQYMNQQKIGIFISRCRKEKGMTQGQLAERLGITDKAVSKWETGKSMPDLSLFVPLCGLLGITLNELFAGERIPAEQLKEKTDEVLFQVITNWLGEGCREKGSLEMAGRDYRELEADCDMLKVENVSKRYRTGIVETSALRQVSFQVRKGSFVGIMGASGSGKTTLLNLIATIDKPSGGTIEINGRRITDIPETETAKFRREHLGFIFQEYNLLNTLTIYENIALALTMREAAEEKMDERIRELAEKLDISSVLSKFPYEVSGGQRQRCACARAVIVEPDIILADEPTGALDSVAARQLLNIFMMLCREYGVTILMVTHDVLSASYCDRILFMRDGEIRTSLERGQSDRSSFFAGILEKTASLENEIEKERPHARRNEGKKHVF